MVITRTKIFNIHKSKVKRTMSIANLDGISKNTNKKKQEFTIHIPSEYDYRFVSEK